jgi:hypothetical protein
MIEQLQSPPRLDPTPEWIAARRDHVVRELAATSAPATRPRRIAGWRVVAVAFAVLVLASGVAVAATGFDILDWIRSDNPSEATFSIDTGRVVSGPFPDSLVCAEPSETGAFTCVSDRTGRWVYILYDRVEARPELTREAALAGLADAERSGAVSQERADQIRADLAAVGDEFFHKVALLGTVTTISALHEVRPGVVLVPPPGVPQFVTCENGSDLECRALPESAVPVGAPVYGLDQNDEWVEQRFEREGPRDVAPLYEGLFGRPLTPVEERLVIVLGTAAADSGPEVEGGDRVVTQPPGG